MAQTSSDLQSILGSDSSEEQKPEEIRDQMAETRASLTEKLDSLQERVEETVEAAHASVDETVSAVKHTVQDTIQTVKRAFDVRYQVEQRPLTMVGVSVLAGYALGCLAPRARAMRTSMEVHANGTQWESRSPMHLASPAPLPVPAQVEQPRAEGSILHQFDAEIDKLKGVAIGAAMGWFRDYLKESMPTVSEQLGEVIDSATRKLGGEPVAASRSRLIP
jgi:hypothetical protein